MLLFFHFGETMPVPRRTESLAIPFFASGVLLPSCMTSPLLSLSLSLFPSFAIFHG